MFMGASQLWYYVEHLNAPVPAAQEEPHAVTYHAST